MLCGGDAVDGVGDIELYWVSVNALGLELGCCFLGGLERSCGYEDGNSLFP